MEIKAYISQVTGNRYDASEYNNHGYGGVYRGMNDLPKSEYPYWCEMWDPHTRTLHRGWENLSTDG